MKPRKNTILILLLGLLLVAFVAVTAQTPAQGEQKKSAEACCATDSRCCSGDSCQLTNAGTTAVADTTAGTEAKAKPDCCSSDSCDMNMKHDAMMKHDATMKHDMKGHKSGDCCKIKSKDKTKTKKAA